MRAFQVASLLLLLVALMASIQVEAKPQLQVVSKSSRHLNDLQDFGGTPASSYFPMTECQGDCDEDADCEGDLICFQRGRGGVPVPGCDGGSEATSKSDFCIRPELVDAEERTSSESGSVSFASTESDFDFDVGESSGMSIRVQTNGMFLFLLVSSMVWLIIFFYH